MKDDRDLDAFIAYYESQFYGCPMKLRFHLELLQSARFCGANEGCHATIALSADGKLATKKRDFNSGWTIVRLENALSSECLSTATFDVISSENGDLMFGIIPTRFGDILEGFAGFESLAAGISYHGLNGIIYKGGTSNNSDCRPCKTGDRVAVQVDRRLIRNAPRPMMISFLLNGGIMGESHFLPSEDVHIVVSLFSPSDSLYISDFSQK